MLDDYKISNFILKKKKKSKYFSTSILQMHDMKACSPFAMHEIKIVIDSLCWQNYRALNVTMTQG
jgi:hypothetical protein